MKTINNFINEKINKQEKVVSEKLKISSRSKLEDIINMSECVDIIKDLFGVSNSKEFIKYVHEYMGTTKTLIDITDEEFEQNFILNICNKNDITNFPLTHKKDSLFAILYCNTEYVPDNFETTIRLAIIADNYKQCNANKNDIKYIYKIQSNII